MKMIMEVREVRKHNTDGGLFCTHQSDLALTIIYYVCAH